MKTVNGSFLSFLKREGLIDGKKQIISEYQNLPSGNKKSVAFVNSPKPQVIQEKPVIMNLNPANICEHCGLVDDCVCESHFDDWQDDGPLSFADGYDEEIKGWGDWTDDMILQDEEMQE